MFMDKKNISLTSLQITHTSDCHKKNLRRKEHETLPLLDHNLGYCRCEVPSCPIIHPHSNRIRLARRTHQIFPCRFWDCIIQTGWIWRRPFLAKPAKAKHKKATQTERHVHGQPVHSTHGWKAKGARVGHSPVELFLCVYLLVDSSKEVFLDLSAGWKHVATCSNIVRNV